MGVVNDNFNRADQSLSADIGWISVAGFNECQVISNQCSAPNVNGAYFNCRSSSDRDTQFSQATVVSLDSSSVLRLLLRFSAADLSGYVAELQSISVFIYRLDAGALTQLSSVSNAISGGDIIKFQASGQLLAIYQNGVAVLSVADSRYSSGAVGIGVSVLFSGHVGVWDNWLGGDGITVRAGVFSKDRVLYVGSFDAGIIPNYGLFDDDFVDQSDGTTVGATVSGMTSTCAGLFDRDANLFGLYGAS